MDNSVTFILGAGFSVPAGFPTAKKLGEQIINSGNMPIAFRNGKLCFRNDGTKPDFGFNDPTEEAFQFGLRLINYYNSKYSSFQYEDFYDYLMQLHLCAGDNKETIDSNIIKLLSISYSTNNERSNLYQQIGRASCRERV